uniref:SS18, subunit of BAF chromatin remodeling complex n=1 Tax=Mus musculus TaxID=10090 RepID=A0A3Q4EI07_MOUSE
MSVAFAAPRQRGKGEITPAAIQKVSADIAYKPGIPCYNSRL